VPEPAVADLTALQLLDAGLARAAEQPLVQYRGRWHSGAEILAGAHGLAAAMQTAGLGHGQCVWVIVTDNLSAMQMQLGAWLLGASTLMLDFRSTAHRFAQIRQILPPDLVVTTRPVAVATALNPLTVTAQPGALVATGAWSRVALADHFATSGSTGMPKLRAIQQDRLGLRISQMLDNGARGPWGVALSALSVAYPASRLVWMRNLAAGVPVIALDLLHSLAELDSALMRPDVQECTLPPTLIRRLAHLPPSSLPRYPHLKKLQSVGGPALASDKLLAVQQLTPHYLMTYSSTECGVISRITGAEVLKRPASCGRAVPGVQITISHNGRPCAVGDTGEIEVTLPDGAQVQTGDIGWLDDAGYLFVAGRVEGLLCRNGVNFSAEGLIQAAMQAAETTDAAVVALTSADGGDQVHLVVECGPAAQSAIAAQIRAQLPAAEHPDQVHFRLTLPRGPGGKIDMPRLRADIVQHAARGPGDER
jgi:acyl-CoA synthetase (AMP-forming)/AMP-acid ligase II